MFSSLLIITCLTITLIIYCLIKVYERFTLSKFRQSKSSKKKLPENAPPTIISNGFFELYIKVFKMIFLNEQASQPEYITKFENYKKKPLHEQIGLEHSFFLHKSYLIVHDYEATSKILLDSKTFNKSDYFSNPYDPNKIDDRKTFEEREKKRMGLSDKRLFGKYGLAFLNGEDHRKLRLLLEPAFYNIERFMNVLKKKTDECLDLWETESKNGKEVKIVPYFPRLTLDMLGLCILGHNFNSLKEDSDPYIESYHYIVKRQVLSRELLEFYNYLPIKENYELNRHLERLNGMTFDLIEQSKRRIKERIENKNNNQQTIQQEEEEWTLLDRMVETIQNESTEERLSLEELRDNIILFFIAGHETTANALSSALFCLAKYPNVQEKLVKEIDQISIDESKDRDNLPSWDVLNNQLPYLKAFINEVLRFYPPVSQVVPRVTTKDTELCGYHIPKGTLISPNLYASVMGDHWGDPQEFRPERWLERSKLPSLTSYVPFGGGKHICIGNKFSLCEQTIFLYSLLRKFKVEFPQGIKHDVYPFKKGQPVFITMEENVGFIFKNRN